MLFKLNVVPLINKPTRVSRKSATAIDNILTNNFADHSLEAGIIKTDISDHFPIFVIIENLVNKRLNKTIPTLKRDLSKNNLEVLKKDTNKETWDSVYQAKGTNNSFSQFMKIFSHYFDKNWPLKSVQLKVKTLNNIPG